jgi:AAA+ ATPase superfamily predicted ATPase
VPLQLFGQEIFTTQPPLLKRRAGSSPQGDRPRPIPYYKWSVHSRWQYVFSRSLIGWRRLADDRRLIIILDEFPGAVELDPSLPPRLQTAWDILFKDSRVSLVISGSHIAVMESLLRSEAPLFGCMTGKLFVPPFQFTEIEAFIKRYALDKQLAVYAIIGGDSRLLAPLG